MHRLAFAAHSQPHNYILYRFQRIAKPYTCCKANVKAEAFCSFSSLPFQSEKKIHTYSHCSPALNYSVDIASVLVLILITMEKHLFNSRASREYKI